MPELQLVTLPSSSGLLELELDGHVDRLVGRTWYARWAEHDDQVEVGTFCAWIAHLKVNITLNSV